MNRDSPQLSKNERRNLDRKSKGKDSKNEREREEREEKGKKREGNWKREKEDGLKRRKMRNSVVMGN